MVMSCLDVFLIKKLPCGQVLILPKTVEGVPSRSAAVAALLRSRRVVGSNPYGGHHNRLKQQARAAGLLL